MINVGMMGGADFAIQSCYLAACWPNPSHRAAHRSLVIFRNLYGAVLAQSHAHRSEEIFAAFYPSVTARA